MAPTRDEPSAKLSRINEVARYFLKVGTLGFGGPLALVASYQKDLIEGRGWMPPEDYARALALIKALPGPISTQMAIHLGRVRAGLAGGLVAGACLILPAFVMMLLLATFYSNVEAFAWAEPLLFGMQAAAIGVIADSVLKLCKPYRASTPYWMMAAAAVGLTALLPASEPLVIIGIGLLSLAVSSALSDKGATTSLLALALPPIAQAPPMAAAVSGFGAAGVATGSGALGSLALVMLKSGALVFGTGLAIVPLLAHDTVDARHWLTHRQFMDALAFGQITPGPVVITATFIGYKVAGVLGAFIATAGIFAPSFFNILTWFPFAERALGGSPRTKDFVRGAVAAVSGSITTTIVRLSVATIAASPGGAPLATVHAVELVVLALVAMIASAASPLPVWGVIPAGGVVGLIVESMVR